MGQCRISDTHPNGQWCVVWYPLRVVPKCTRTWTLWYFRVHASARHSLQHDAHDVCMHNAAMPNDAVWPGFPAVAATGKIKL
jgi:hypothetical protein